MCKIYQLLWTWGKKHKYHGWYRRHRHHHLCRWLQVNIINEIYPKEPSVCVNEQNVFNKMACKHPHIRTTTEAFHVDIMWFWLNGSCYHEWQSEHIYVVYTVPVHLRSQFLRSIFHILRSYGLLEQLNFHWDEM